MRFRGVRPTCCPKTRKSDEDGPGVALTSGLVKTAAEKRSRSVRNRVHIPLYRANREGALRVDFGSSGPPLGNGRYGALRQSLDRCQTPAAAQSGRPHRSDWVLTLTRLRGKSLAGSRGRTPPSPGLTPWLLHENDDPRGCQLAQTAPHSSGRRLASTASRRSSSRSIRRRPSSFSSPVR